MFNRRGVGRLQRKAKDPVGAAPSKGRSPMPLSSSPTIGLIGCGAFGRLIARHLAPHFALSISDPACHALPDGLGPRARLVSLDRAARCDVVILAVPVAGLATLCQRIAPMLAPGAVIVDVGSVKSAPVAVMRTHLPGHVQIVGTHPLFGPQSARDGVAGHKIALCPVRGAAHLRVGAFLRRMLRLKVIVTTPDAHDREAAVVQGLTHLIARVLVEMGPLPARMTTASYERLLDAVAMVRDDPPGVLHAIESANPHAAEIRERFFATAASVRDRFEAGQV